jgi:hypothetical protein
MIASCIEAVGLVNLSKKNPPPSKAAGKRGVAGINQHMVNERRKGWLRSKPGQWDCVAHKPARLDAGDLFRCTAQRAKAAEKVLTRNYGGGLDAPAVRMAGIVA